ncbi:MAG: ribosome maturation factor RimM [Terriglobales bacterium]
MDNRSEPSAWVALARIVKTQGRRGELGADLLTDIPGRIEALPEVWLLARSGARRRFAIERHWPHLGRLVLKLAGLDDLNAAEPWVGAEVQVPAGERAAAPDGSYFLSDLEGCELLDHGRRVGVIEAIEEIPGSAALLHVRAQSGGELLIPFAAAYLTEMALERRTVAMDLPEGLCDIN